MPCMRSFLQQPYPFSENWQKKLAVCGGIGVFIAAFLAIFAPFGMNEVPLPARWLHALLFGAVTFFIASFMEIVLPRLLPKLFREERWRSWKEIVFLLLITALVGAGNFALMLLLYPQPPAFSRFLMAELITLEIGVFPVCFVVFMKQLLLYRRYAAGAQQTTNELGEEPPVKATAVLASPLHLRGDNQKEELRLPPADLYFIASADNYVNLCYAEKGKVKTALFRSTLKKMEEQLPPGDMFFRCHRMYLVNLRQVSSVSGNAQGLKLHLAGLAEPVPVSRSLTETVREKLHRLSHSPQNA